MDVIFFYILFFCGIWLISVIVSKINEAIRKKRERIRDKVAEELLSGLNIEVVIDSYKRKLGHIKYTRSDPVRENAERDVERLKGQIWGRDAVLTLERCPKCKEGHLITRKGPYGKFLACTKYPQCDYRKNIVKAREEYKKSINEKFIDEIQKAYL